MREQLTFSVLGKEKVLYYQQHGNIDLGFKAGDTVDPGFQNFAMLKWERTIVYPNSERSIRDSNGYRSRSNY